MGLYIVRKYFFEEKKFLGYNRLANKFSETNQSDFKALPAKVAQHILKLVHQNFKSFFALLIKKKSGEYSFNVKIPKYLPKVTRRQIKASRYIVSQLVSRNVTDLIIGHNAGWKKGTNLGKKTNQNFVSIPFNKFIDMLTYKCALEGISIHITDESYTSKASFLDRDFILDHKSADLVKHKFSGRRKYRGLYKSKNFAQSINADVNGSLNIMRKFFQYHPNFVEPMYSEKILQCSPKVFTIG